MTRRSSLRESRDLVTYFEKLPKPLRDEIREGRCVPIVGSGFSKNAALTDATMPDWAELATVMADDLQLAGSHAMSDPIDLISSYEFEHGRVALVQRLRSLLHVGKAQPGDAHLAFARVPFPYVVTTNFDQLLEDGYRAEGVTCGTIVDESQLSVAVDRAARTLIKLHGDIDRPDTLVLTEDDYDRFISNKPLLATEIASLLVRRTALLIGYSLSDPNVRQLLVLLRNRLGRLMRPLYVLAFDPSPSDVARYERRGVHVIDLGVPRGIDRRVALTDLFDAMTDAALDGGVSAIVESRSRIAEDVTERSHYSNVVYFSVATELLPFCREFLYPVVESRGLVAASLDDVPEGANTAASTEGLIRRALGVVSSPTKLGLQTELRAAQRFQIPVFPLAVPRGELGVSDIDGSWFLAASQLGEWLDATPAVVDQRYRFSREPWRLFDKREYRAAVVAAISLLETTLRERLERAGARPKRKGFMGLVEEAMSYDLLGPVSFDDVASAASLRNRVAHTKDEISRKDANGVLSLVDWICTDAIR